MLRNLTFDTSTRRAAHHHHQWSVPRCPGWGCRPSPLV